MTISGDSPVLVLVRGMLEGGERLRVSAILRYQEVYGELASKAGDTL